MHKRPLAVIAVFFIIGIVLAKYLPDSVKFIHIFIITLIFIPLTLILSPKGRGKASNIFLLLSITSFAVLLYVNFNIFPNNHNSYFLGEERLKTNIVGIIKSPALTRKPYYGKINSTYLFEIEGIKCTSAQENVWLGVQGLAQIRIQTEKDYGYGDRLLVKGTIRNPKSEILNSKQIQNPKSKKNHFDYGEYLARQNIPALINTRENNVTTLSHNYKSNPILRYIYLVRAKLKNRIIEKMPLESGAFLRAILLGDRSELPKDIQTSFKKSGTMHIFPNQNRQKLSYSS